MKTLYTLFTKERSEVQTEIDKATSPEQVVKLVQKRLDNIQSSYVGELSVAQVRLASLFLDTLRQSLGTLTAANEAISEPEPQQSANPARKVSPKTIILKVLQGLICIGILDSLFSLASDAPGAWMDILLVSLLVGLEVVFQIDKRDRANRSVSLQPVEAPQPIVRVDSQVFLDNLTDALNTIDLAVARTQEVKKPLDASGIEELPELLNLLQRLMGASILEKPQMSLQLTKLLPQILMEQGIRVQIYQGNDTHREYFDFEPSIDPAAKESVTITPALFKGDRLLRRGRVIEPAYSEARE
ncbi:hypothetical protein H6F78_04135 [Coleofasciculus sp. FACHB-64]|uniref:hypothetical protein n=1 Tax=Cyanophyceae TaxID=3028117 RepID=UPI0016820FB7|nr:MULTISPECIES: hypothetical protein [unclassified Coleofasciculus]MBD1837288.1 hypothetical protein [Coleofasciculus sp. FACHB-501]MBD2044828.1 hypothetical protein [Coleofasciculus sp. FACHB-64]MBD2086050.1 hypothetical protein [Coleofasciculus sp. FACHB-542]